MRLLREYVPYNQIVETRSTHPWLNERCRIAVTQKNEAEGSNRFQEASAHCAAVLKEEHQKYMASLLMKLASLPRCSKKWWRLNRELLNKKANISSIPPL